MFQKFGPTHAINDGFGVPKSIHTIDPINCDSFLNKNAQDWVISPRRGQAIYPLGQHGIFTTHGEVWRRNRKIAQRHIGQGTRRARNTENVEPDVKLLFEAIDAIGETDGDGWTGTFSLLDILYRFGLDSTMRQTLGKSTDTQIDNMEQKTGKQFPDRDRSEDININEVRGTLLNTIVNRVKLGDGMWWLATSLKHSAACRTFKNFADSLVKDTIGRHKSGSGVDESTGLVGDLAREGYDDVDLIRELVVDMMLAGQSTVGPLIAFLISELERQPDLFAQLRAEIIEKFGSEKNPAGDMSLDALKGCTLLQNCVNEALRMYPIMPIIDRRAIRDTTLPRGGGPSGDIPLAIPAGTPVISFIWHVHRLPSEWGPDATVFNPSRWQNRKTSGPEFIPFGAGQRVCIGQQLATTEILYLVARMVQRFDGVEREGEVDNLRKRYTVVVSPKEGTRVRLHRAVD
ncbi:cytochrome P450 [Aulographum hederae CBS 113979]|uniref:Cytochrome P450 n=1 Tax=Aulographum hederae CBS 113979 TaxID=1176131 RepID=A0A6G1GXC0_9PEZI|nr:cytochrome P450 [Aulographum hederae CBS 113979]